MGCLTCGQLCFCRIDCSFCKTENEKSKSPDNSGPTNGSESSSNNDNTLQDNGWIPISKGKHSTHINDITSKMVAEHMEEDGQSGKEGSKDATLVSDLRETTQQEINLWPNLENQVSLYRPMRRKQAQTQSDLTTRTVHNNPSLQYPATTQPTPSPSPTNPLREFTLTGQINSFQGHRHHTESDANPSTNTLQNSDLMASIHSESNPTVTSQPLISPAADPESKSSHGVALKISEPHFPHTEPMAMLKQFQPPHLLQTEKSVSEDRSISTIQPQKDHRKAPSKHLAEIISPSLQEDGIIQLERRKRSMISIHVPIQGKSKGISIPFSIATINESKPSIIAHHADFTAGSDHRLDSCLVLQEEQSPLLAIDSPRIDEALLGMLEGCPLSSC